MLWTMLGGGKTFARLFLEGNVEDQNHLEIPLAGRDTAVIFYFLTSTGLFKHLLTRRKERVIGVSLAGSASFYLI